MKVFVTGHKGYIGVHLVDLLKQAGHTVTGCDLGLFDGCAWEEVVPADRDLHMDVRDVTLKDLTGHDCVMHLAAISNDPMGEVDAAATYAINRDASIRIAQLAKKAGVPRYLFAASCSVYGAGKKLDLDEGDPLNPLTAYAKSKIETEQAGFQTSGSRFHSRLPAQRNCLRAFRHVTHRPRRQQSPRMRSRHWRNTHHVGRFALAPAHPLPRHRPSLRCFHECTKGNNSQQSRERRRQW